MSSILPILIGGLILFLFAMTELSSVMKSLFSEKARKSIERYTSNIFSAILLGTIFTILLGSSSAVIIIVIVLINSHALSFKQAIGIILGANIGTTFSSQIIALDIGEYAIIPMILGLFIQFLSKNEKKKGYGKATFYFGLLFFGLFLMQESVAPLQESPVFETWIANAEGNALSGALIGGLVTLIIQSSSGTVGMAIVLGKKGLLSAAGGIAIMLGAELGTCSDTLLATIKGNKQAIKAGVFHLLFNLSTIILGLILFIPLTSFIHLLSPSPDIGRIIATGHMLFNLLGVLSFLPFIGLAERGLNKLLPDSPQQ